MRVDWVQRRGGTSSAFHRCSWRRLRATKVSESPELRGVPPEVAVVLDRVRAVFSTPDVIAVIVIGSTARGEMSFFRSHSTLMVRSDIEFYVLARRPRRLRRQLAPVLSALEREYTRKWPAFHIDASYLTPARFRRLKPLIRHFELKKNGTTLLGEELISLAPEVTLDNLDWRELNDVVMWSLLSLAVRIPAEWLAGRKDLPPEDRVVIARNILDITTWALPGLGVLLPTFSARNGFWETSRVQHQIAGTPLPTAATLHECFRARSTDANELDANLLFAQTVKAWSFAYDVVRGRRAWRHRGSGKGFSALGPLRHARAMVRVRSCGPGVARRSLSGGCYALAAAAAYDLCRAALAMRRAANPWHHLHIAAETLHLRVSTPSSEIAWRILRNELARYMDAALARAEWRRLIPEKESE